MGGSMTNLKRIGLCMIVKNEAPIIGRCLSAVRPFIDYALIVDTGSTDATIATIRAFFAQSGLQGEVISEYWRDFAYNRSFALAKLRERRDIDYALMIDADDKMVFSATFDPVAIKAGLNADIYNIETRMGGYTYVRPQLISNRKNFFFRGVLHEFVDCDEAFTQETLKGCACLSIQDSARNQNPDKYARDAQTLLTALERETDPFMRSRYTFYLAQSFRDCGRHAEALAYYLQRAELGFWDQEIYISLYHAGRCAEMLDRPSSEILDLYLRAFDLCPTRAEALHGAARHCRLKSRFHTGYIFAKRGIEIPKPDSGLFLADWIFDYGMRDELAVLAYWTGRYAECLSACETLLDGPDLPDSDRIRIVENMRFARAALRDSASLAEIAGERVE
jgi:glycosyltransferase involved in cell wall biosynthesis